MSVLDRALAVQARAAIATAQRRLQWWARSFRGVQARFGVMAAPPAVTIGGATSALTGNANYAVTAKWDSGLVTLAGSKLYASDGNAPSKALPIVHTYSDNSQSGNASVSQRLRFMTDAPAFEIPVRGVSAQINAIIDGEFVTRTRNGVPEINFDLNVHQVKFDFGADTAAYQLVSIAKSAAGSGYAVGDTITFGGGTGTPAVVQVVSVSSGAVAGNLLVINPGNYSAYPTGTVAQGSTSGTGTGATFAVNWGKTHTTVKKRKVEILFPGGIQGIVSPIAGVNVAAGYSVRPWPVSTRVPRLLVLGDSQQSTYTDYAGGNPGYTIAQMLGLADGFVLTNNGGTGYIQANGTSLPWSDARRIADIVAQAPDIVLIIGGQNDGTQAMATLTATVTTMLNTLAAALPNTVFVGIGPVTGNSAALQAAIVAGWAAAAPQSRMRFIDNYTSTPFLTASNQNAGPQYAASDTVHLVQFANDMWAEAHAPLIADALLSMIV